MAEDEARIPGGGSPLPSEESTPATTTDSPAVAGAVHPEGLDVEEQERASDRVSVPLAMFPAAAIVGIAVLGALAGPVWASAGAAFCVTAFGMWVARVSHSLTTALLTGAIGVLVTAGVVVFYSTAEPDPTGGSQTQGPSAKGAHLGGVDFSGADLRRIDLRDADLRAVDFTGACLRASDLRGADLRDADFANADVTGSLVDDAKQTSVARNWPTATPVPSPCRG